MALASSAASPREPLLANTPLLLGAAPRIALAAATSLLLWLAYALIR